MPELVPIHYATPVVHTEARADGSLILTSGIALPPYARCIGDWLVRHAATKPDQTFLAERRLVNGVPDMTPGAWRTATYGEALAQVRALAQGLLARDLSVKRPLVILSDNSINHALLALACQHIGVPVAPLSQAYCLMSKDFAKLKAIFTLLQPGAVYAEDGAKFAPAIAALRAAGFTFELICTHGTPEGATTFEQLPKVPSPAVDHAFAQVNGDTIAKFLFTSGSTGAPKAVINTQRMLTSNMTSWAAAWPFFLEEPMTYLDWMPWNHTFGGNADVGVILCHGGMLYIDNGKPAPGLVDHTATNLREVAPTVYLNVPRGFDMLLPFLEQDAIARKNFFSRLKMIFYAGAALPQNLWERLEKLSIAETGKLVRMTSAWGSTETAPMATVVHWAIDKAGVIGNPGPGTSLKLLPLSEVAGKMKYEIRVKGPGVTPGYWKAPDLTAAAFDEDGFYKIGDAVQFDDPADHAKGVLFAGRVSEEFKLSSGTWVHTGALRVKAVAALAPLAQDIVIAGHDRDDIGFLIFPNLSALRGLAKDMPEDASPERLFEHIAVRAALLDGLQTLRAQGGGSSTYARRALFLIEPPNIDVGEITDKGYVNQRAVLDRRAALVKMLYDAPPLL